MGAGEVFILENTGAETNVSNTAESDVSLSGTPTAQGDWSGQYSQPEITVPEAGIYLFGYSAKNRSSGTTRSGALCQFSLNTGGGHSLVGIEGVTTWGYIRTAGGHDEATWHGCYMDNLSANDIVKVRQGTQLNSSDRRGDYDRTSGDPRGIWAVNFGSSQDYLFANTTGTDVGSGVYNNTPRPIDLGTPSTPSGGSLKIITWDNTSASSGTVISRSGSTFTIAANSIVLIDAKFQFTGASDRNSAMIAVYKDGSPYCWVTCYHRGNGYNDGSTAVVTVPVITGGSSETIEFYMIDQVEEATSGEMDCTSASARFIDLTGQDICVLAKTDADITNIDNTWRQVSFPTADEVQVDSDFDHPAGNLTRIENNAGEEITVLSGAVVCWDKSTSNSSRKEPGHQLRKTGSELDYAIWSQYIRGTQSGDDQFVGGSSFCAPVVLGSSDYLELSYQDVCQNGAGDGMVLNCTDGASILFWAIRLDDLGGAPTGWGHDFAGVSNANIGDINETAKANINSVGGKT